MAQIALYGAGGSPYNHAAILARAGHRIGVVFPQDIAAGALRAFDVFVMPGGGYHSMAGQLSPLGGQGCRLIREYVESGGMYIGSCAGAYDAATVSNRSLASCPEQAELRLLDTQVWNDNEDIDDLESPGIGEIICESVAADHPVMADMPQEFHVTHYNGPLFDSRYALARVTGVAGSFTAAEEFFGTCGGDHLIDRAIAAGAANLAAGRRGRGRVVLFGSHPEFGRTLSLDDVTPAARLLSNAVNWQLNESGWPARPAPALACEAAIPQWILTADRAAAMPLATQIAERCERLSDRLADAPWLEVGAALSMFGRTPRDIWAAALTTIPALASEAAAGCQGLPDHLCSFRPPAAWPTDFGFCGAVPLLQQSDEMLAKAETEWLDAWPGRVAEPYAFEDESPYHLVAGSYLSALGRVAAAALLSRTLSAPEVQPS